VGKKNGQKYANDTQEMIVMHLIIIIKQAYSYISEKTSME